ncbi:MAG: tetratricopeptide repeat protein [Treponema sp.]|jgi:tetratricopeptide (TPR) repeat protein|nr:tetratricopeptide repeat protein [Treponema sp.]
MIPENVIIGRKSRYIRLKFGHLTAMLVVLLVLLIPLPLLIAYRSRLSNERKSYLELWQEGNYQETYERSLSALEKKPLDYFLLTLHGFSAFQIGISQINNFDTLNYIDECIWSLRKALLVDKRDKDSRIYYVLGKAYYYKGANFADLSVSYLEKAGEAGIDASDIYEYLGMAYASIRDYHNSVASFSQALNTQQPSDTLLISIARSYIAMGEMEPAKAYLLRCIDISRDSKTILTARLHLAEILGNEGDAGQAEAQYMAILNESGENAEAHFRLGLLYSEKGDTTRARAEWRRAVRIDPAHANARARLNM